MQFPLVGRKILMANGTDHTDKIKLSTIFPTMACKVKNIYHHQYELSMLPSVESRDLHVNVI